METQSSDRQAGTMPAVGTSPRVGFSPTMLLKAAGTRPEPAVSVPSAKATRPGARAARNEIGVERVAADAVRRARADEAGGELVEIGLADQQRTGALQPVHHRRRSRWRIGVVGASGRRGHAEDIDIVLDREGQAEKRQIVNRAGR